MKFDSVLTGLSIEFDRDEIIDIIDYGPTYTGLCIRSENGNFRAAGGRYIIVPVYEKYEDVKNRIYNSALEGLLDVDG